MTYLLAEKALTEKGIIPGKDMEILETATFSNIMQLILLDEADVGATPVSLWDNLEHDNAEQYNQLREIYRSQSAAPSILVMASPATDPATIPTLRESLMHFQETPEGKIFFKKNRFESFQPIDDASMESAAPFVHVLMPPQ
jgi:ABC-type phosphate/phosphonate transport system substrate-binding protein